MLSKLLKNIINFKNNINWQKFWALVDQINTLEPRLAAISNTELAVMTQIFQKKLSKKTTLNNLLPETFATTREAAKRTIGQRHFDVQLIGGIVLHQSKIAEMKTGEGKTLAATLPIYLNALTGHGVHIITVNDYLAARDAKWMGKIYHFLGLTVGCITRDLNDTERKKAYNANITYGTNNEFSFDYLRDNMKFDLIDIVQREFYYAIIDEVDSILIDEARTPLIISGPTEKPTRLYFNINRIIPLLVQNRDFSIDEKIRTVCLTDEGLIRCEKILALDNLYDQNVIDILHHIQQALKAHTIFKRDVDYIVKNNEVIIVDEFTGRLMPGRRYSDGLHQAIEAKENLKIANENQTLATITFQNYFRMYKKLAGMTGTAETEAEEFHKIYKLNVIIIPTHRRMIRIDHNDIVYRTQQEKNFAIIQKIKNLHDKGQPVLVGTTSIEKSEILSNQLKSLGIQHTILNAKQHAHEAEIIAQAGRQNAVTISTNMAGRGTDIILGGKINSLTYQDIILQKNENLYLQERKKVQSIGGLAVIGTERHESRRIDNQLRGRSGRQGDPGSSYFYLSLEDDLLRLFGSDRISGLMQKLGMSEGEPIKASIINKAIENAQRKVEGRNFGIRKNLLEYDDVLNKQRELIYTQRHLSLTEKNNIHNIILEMIDEFTKKIIIAHTNQVTDSNKLAKINLESSISSVLGFKPEINKHTTWTIDNIINKLKTQWQELYLAKTNNYGQTNMSYLERMILLQKIDNFWKYHLFNMDSLKEGIGLRSYGQKDPLREYQREGYKIFMEMITRIKTETIATLIRTQIKHHQNTESIIKQYLQ